jgi:hypothetical protein
MKLDKICIVGGGSAGWMTAAMLSQHFGDTKEIVLIESSIPKIGVGESTTQFFNDFVRYLGLKDEEWMPACDATYKHSVRFHNFNPNGDFHYPFGQTTNVLPITDYFNWRRDNKVDSMTFGRVFSDVIDPIENRRLYPQNLNRFVGYHIDAVKFSEYLKSKYSHKIGYMMDTVKGIQTDDGGICMLHLESGRFVDADLYIDCTGFKALLLNKIHTPWNSWGWELKTDSTWATRLDYEYKEDQLVAYTNCTGLSAGWVWNVPTWSRIGTGYNYCSDYISDEDALKEFRDHLGVGEDHECRLLKWPTGMREKVWHKNVVGIGLSAGFIEPLESGGLYSVHEFLWKLIQVLPKSSNTWNAFKRQQFNHAVRTKFESFRDFVVKHYSMGVRDDTPFWKYYNDLDNEGEFPDILTLDWDKLSRLDYLPEGMGYLLGGYEYDIIPEHYTELSKENGFDLEDFSDIISERLAPRSMEDYPRTIDYYLTHIYKEQ